MIDKQFDDIRQSLLEYFASHQPKLSIGLQNFQSIREYTEIPLSPITLIYGQNSSGKSAIHDALKFISNFLSGADGISESLDRWASHQRKDRPLTDKFVGDNADVVITVTGSVMNTISFDTGVGTHGAGQLLLELLSDMQGVARTELRYHFSSNPANPFDSNWYIRAFSLKLGRDELFSYRASFDENKEPLDETEFCINSNHPLIDAVGRLSSVSFERMTEASELFNGFFDNSKGNIIIQDLKMNMGNNNLKWSADEYPWSHKEYTEFSEELQNALKFRSLITGILEAATMPAGMSALFYSVPPLRPIPSIQESVINLAPGIFYKSANTPWEKLACDIKEQEFFDLWESIHPEYKFDRGKVKLGTVLPYVNHVLQHPLFLDTGYMIIGSTDFLISKTRMREILDDCTDWCSHLTGLQTRVKLLLKHVPDDYDVEIEDVGVGISQIIPVLCAIEGNSKVYIQQPELHLHPKHQSHLGDILIERVNSNQSSATNSLINKIDNALKELDKLMHGWSNKSFLIETHSEHILLRILRRIRESNRADIKNKLFSFSASQLSVLYVDKDGNGDSRIYQLRVADDGTFIDRWPHGFFTERDADLFDE